jgi:uncharacterized protein (DUF2236 family)
MASGYFTDDSMLRIVHRERALALSGQRALLMQAAHPLAVAGLLAHTTSADSPYERLGRTAQVMGTIGFGTRADADRVTRRVRAMHRRVRGTLPEAVGPYPAGTPYAADMPELLMWVLFTLVDSGIVVYSRYVRSMDDGMQAAYWDDYKVVGELFGLRRRDMPDTLADLRDYRREMLASGRLVVGEWARTNALRIVFSPPVPLPFQPLVQTANFVTVALLPDEIRRQYELGGALPPMMVRRALVAGGAEYVKRVLIPLLPDRLRLVPRARPGVVT